MNFLDMFLNRRSKGTIPEIEKKKKLTCESNSSEKYE